jgi:hypothetical protein
MRSAAVTILLAALAAGCGPTRGPAPPVGPPALPVLPPGEVIEAHNQWADSVAEVWSRAAVTLSLPSGGTADQRLHQDLDGHLFMVKPERLYVHGMMLGQEIFKLGMNAERFWLWVRPRVNTVWTGRRGGEGERRFIISPGDVMTALGLFRIDLEPGEPAVFEAQPRHYVLTQQQRLAGQLLPRRRIWFDRATLRPARVDLYDQAGQRLLLAELLAYEYLDGTPVCTAYRARFYGDEEVDLVLRLTDVRLDKKVNPKVFEYVVPPGAKEEDLDVAKTSDEATK